MNIVLIGLMGTGKTTVGRQLATRLGFEFLDTDALIEERTGLRITVIFAVHGEAFFRDLEAKLAQDLIKTAHKVIATGGGFVLKPENMKAMKQSGVVVALTATPEVILDRIKDNHDRPLLQTADPLARIAELLEKRMPIYSQADVTIDTSDKTTEKISVEIESELMRRGDLNGRS